MKSLVVFTCLMKLAGVLCLYCTASFLYSLDVIVSASRTIILPYPIVAAIIIAASGFGFTLGVYLVTTGVGDKKNLYGIGIFSLLFLILQAGLTIVPALSSCKCVTLQDSIMSITNWWKVKLAASLFMITIALIILRRNIAQDQSGTVSDQREVSTLN